MKQKLLILTPELPYPLQSGGKVKTWNMLCAFADCWDITLVCPLKEQDADFVEEFLQRAPIEKMISEPVQVPRTAKNLVKSYLQLQPLNLLRTFSTNLAAEVQLMVADFDLVLVDHFEVFQFLPENFFDSAEDRPALVYHAHNAYHQIWQRYGETTKNPAEKIVARLEAARIKCYERKICKQADMVFAAPNDIATLRSIGAESASFKETLHLGDDANLTKPSLDLGATQSKLCYAGFLGWEPNVQGLLWFLDQAWPALKAAVPDLTLDIAGKNPDSRLIAAIEDLPGVELLGFVDDLEDLYRNSRVSISPLLFGSGIKVKVANSMARGIPTVTTSVGAEGLEVCHGEHLMIADSPEQTVKAIISLLVNDGLWQQISNRSRELMRAKYTWKALFKRMFADIESLQRARRKKQLQGSLVKVACAESRAVS